MIHITDAIAIQEREVEESFVRAAGPGGQNVNKVATAVQLRFDVRHSPPLPDAVRARLERLAGRRLTQEGAVIITAQRHRTQERNRQDALERLVELIRRAAMPPTRRRPTKPTASAQRRRLNAKSRRAGIKKLRRSALRTRRLKSRRGSGRASCRRPPKLFRARQDQGAPRNGRGLSRVISEAPQP